MRGRHLRLEGGVHPHKGQRKVARGTLCAGMCLDMESGVTFCTEQANSSGSGSL